jgi:hypothetical protein
MDTLTLSHSTLRGFVTGKAVNCTVRSSPAGLKLAAGRYLLCPAENNPVYGLVMSIEPIRSGGQNVPGPRVGHEYRVEGPAALKIPAMPKVVPSGTTAREGGAAIVVSGRAIAGNSLVVDTGFDDLVDAVQRTGGVTLVVT